MRKWRALDRNVGAADFDPPRGADLGSHALVADAIERGNAGTRANGSVDDPGVRGVRPTNRDG